MAIQSPEYPHGVDPDTITLAEKINEIIDTVNRMDIAIRGIFKAFDKYA